MGFQQEVQCQLTEIFAALDQLSPCDGTRRRCASPEMETVPNSITLITEQLLAEFRDFQVEVRSRLKEVSTEVDGLQRSGSQIKSEVYEMKQAMRDLIIGLRKQFADDLSKSFVSKADSVPARPKRFSGEARQDELAPTPYHRDCALLPREKEFDPDENINQMMGRVDDMELWLLKKRREARISHEKDLRVPLISKPVGMPLSVNLPGMHHTIMEHTVDLPTDLVNVDRAETSTESESELFETAGAHNVLVSVNEMRDAEFPRRSRSDSETCLISAATFSVDRDTDR